MGYRKPDPRFFEALMQKLEIDPENVISVGDKYENDIVAARKSGIHAIWFNMKNDPGEYPEADLIISQMSQLEEAISMIP